MTRRMLHLRLLAASSVACGLGAFVLAASLAGCAPSRAASARAIDAAPRDLDGRVVSITGADAPPATVLIFVRSDCPISNRFAPEINRLDAEFAPRGAAFLLVYVDPDETVDAIRAHLRDYGYRCRAARDPAHALVARCGVGITPEAAVVRRDGELTYRGRINDLYAELGQARAAPTTSDLADAIASTLDHRPVRSPRTRAVGCTIADLKR